MKSTRLTRISAGVAGALVVVVTLAACASGRQGAEEVDPAGDVEWSVTDGATTVPDETDYLDYEDDSSGEAGSDDWLAYNLTCLSVMDEVSPRAAVRALIDGDVVEFSSREEADEWIWDGYDTDPDALRVWAAAGTVDGRTFVWEDNGYSCDDTRTAQRLSASGDFVSMYWNIDASTNFIFAQDGQLKTEFDPLLAPDAATWSVLESNGGEHVSDDDWWSGSSEQSALELQAQLMGLSGPADPSWLDDPSVTFWGYAY